MDYDYLIFIGRFQPFHKGHEWVIRQALDKAKKVIVLIGSADRPRTPKNPFNFDERFDMICKAMADVADRLVCLPLPDVLYNDNKWLQILQQQIAPLIDRKKAAFIGHDKDQSSYYLGLFAHLGVHKIANYKNLSATPIRKAYFENEMASVSHQLPNAVKDWLADFKTTKGYANLKNEYDHIQEYKAQFDVLPYPPIFQTADALVVCQGHILVVERGGEYGKGLFALPGGFVDGNETIAHAAKRELKEETGLDIDDFGVSSHPFASRTIDNPSRSLRGRTITTVFVYQLSTQSLPTLKAKDDACAAFWLPLHQLSSARFFEDHYDIITLMLGVD